MSWSGARKRFGQHFLRDETVIETIVAAVAPVPGQAVVEIGPGQGAITVPLLARLKALDAIELDRDLIPSLQNRCRSVGELHIVAADALSVDLAILARPGPWRVVGNLPYNISTPLLFHLLSQASAIEDMHFMLQREVVERLAASPGGKAYGRLSVMIQYRCRVEVLFEVGPEAFEPPPQVDSAFVRLVPQSPPVAARDEGRFGTLVQAAFAKRRKTLRNALKGQVDPQIFAAAGIDADARAETLTPSAFVALSNALS
ncbi:MAG: 16S rRNA (adenine(1518)-N(6)/adenine(1519)-N(6))-dimethyltransferase RsmA [Candidatus Competibacterales bacterium]